MRVRAMAAGILAAALIAAWCPAAELSPVALRLVGQVRNFANGVNLVEGRELAGPQGLAVDPTGSSSHLYVADTLNHRVLGWRDAARFSSGATADLVIGQPDLFTASSNTPGPALGLWQPWGVAVDAAGNLWIADTGNHRVLRYPQPFAQRIPAPDLVIGQTSLTGRERNMGATDPNEFTLAGPVAVAVNARGDLAVSDAGNRRVLVFSAASLATNGPPAVAVLGQGNFSGSSASAGTAGLTQPAGLAFDEAGRLYVADAGSNRILQYPPAPATGSVTLRVISGNRDEAPRGPQTLLRPLGVAASGEDLWVADTGNHRLLRFSNLGRSIEVRPAADAVFGQAGFTSGLPNGGSRAMPLASAQSLASPARWRWRSTPAVTWRCRTRAITGCWCFRRQRSRRTARRRWPCWGRGISPARPRAPARRG